MITLTLLITLALAPNGVHHEYRAQADTVRREAIEREMIRDYQNRVRREIEMRTLFWMSAGESLANAGAMAHEQICESYDPPSVMAAHGVDCRDNRVTYRAP